MANPNLRNYTSQLDWVWGLVLPDTLAQNILGNSVGSNSVIKADIWAWNVDTVSPVDLTVAIYNAFGTPICSNSGNGATTGVTTSTDVVSGSSLSGPTRITLVAGSGLQLVRRFTLNEGMSVVATATAGNDCGLWIDYSVFTS